MRCHKTDPANAVNLLHLAEKLRKGHGILQILSIGIDILAQQHDLGHTVRSQLLDFPDNVLRLPAPLPATHIGHNAVAAEIIAAEHDVDARPEGVFPLNGKLLHDLLRILPDIYNHAAVLHTFRQKLREFKNIVGTEDQIHEAVALL